MGSELSNEQKQWVREVVAEMQPDELDIVETYMSNRKSAFGWGRPKVDFGLELSPDLVAPYAVLFVAWAGQIAKGVIDKKASEQLERRLFGRRSRVLNSSTQACQLNRAELETQIASDAVTLGMKKSKAEILARLVADRVTSSDQRDGDQRGE